MQQVWERSEKRSKAASATTSTSKLLRIQYLHTNPAMNTLERQ